LIVVVADIHFGKSDDEAERAKERELIACLRSFGDRMEELVLLGDTFDYFIEYRHLVPKGYSRFLGQLAALSDAGVRITYFAGNHDPWHQDYCTTEFGARFVLDDEVRTLHGNRCYLFHGDGVRQNGGLYRRLRPILRHPIPVALYRALLPGDTGVRLARWVSLHFAAQTANRATADGLRRYAEEVLADPEIDVVILGHGHFPEFDVLPGGRYVNPGSWHLGRTFVVVDSNGPQLVRWDGSRVTPYHASPNEGHQAHR
jgi:UDP-2,3-diacylglucosamine hydrolase